MRIESNGPESISGFVTTMKVAGAMIEYSMDNSVPRASDEAGVGGTNGTSPTAGGDTIWRGQESATMTAGDTGGPSPSTALRLGIEFDG